MSALPTQRSLRIKCGRPVRKGMAAAMQRTNSGFNGGIHRPAHVVRMNIALHGVSRFMAAMPPSWLI